MWCERLIDDGAGAVGGGHRRGGVERAQRQPRPRQPAAVPRLHGGARVDDLRLAGLRHRALLDLGEVRREQRQAVRRVAEQVAVDQHGGDVARRCRRARRRGSAVHARTRRARRRGSGNGRSGGHDVGRVAGVRRGRLTVAAIPQDSSGAREPCCAGVSRRPRPHRASFLAADQHRHVSPGPASSSSAACASSRSRSARGARRARCAPCISR